MVNEAAFDQFCALVGELGLHQAFKAHASASKVTEGREDFRIGADQLTANLFKFALGMFDDPTVVTRPLLKGCGLLGATNADLIIDDALCEVKSGDRDFRLADLRQCIVYCAQNFRSRQYELSRIFLVNPRSARCVMIRFEELARPTAGSNAVELFADLTEAFGEAGGGY